MTSPPTSYRSHRTYLVLRETTDPIRLYCQRCTQIVRWVEHQDAQYRHRVTLGCTCLFQGLSPLLPANPADGTDYPSIETPSNQGEGQE